MDTIGDALLTIFYAASLLALGFFLHKVLWLYRYKRIQREIVDDAVRRLREGNATELTAWEESARRRWSSALGMAEVSGPSSFIRRVEEGLAQVRGDLRQSRRSIEALFTGALASGRGAGPGEAKRTTVLSLRRLTHRANEEARWEVAIDLRFPPVPPPDPPDRGLYELRVKSRYGMVRRALVFFSGIADVVYSSQHVALMSQNFHVPTSVLVRRLSLVFLVLFVVVVDMIFHVRRAISEIILAHIAGGGRAGHHDAPSGFESFLGTALGFGVWLAIYGSIYLVLYFSIRRRYEVNVRRLRSMAAGEAENMQQIHRRHLADLVRWGAEYGRSLDSAIEITLRHAEALIDYYGHRVRRRVAGAALLDGSNAIADSLFSKLPEAKGDLLDAATTQRHSLAHWVWPRAEEMEYQVRLAQYRAAWQHLELAVSELRREQPDPARSHDLWRAAISYAAIFAPLLPDGMATSLEEAYARMVAECVAETDKDLAELDRRLGELRRSLGEQLEAARSLVLGRVELTNSQMAATVASLSAEIIHVREQARLEAMAFEI
jgi:succinate dehydrogenase hydrophobic anchor subunit